MVLKKGTIDFFQFCIFTNATSAIFVGFVSVPPSFSSAYRAALYGLIRCGSPVLCSPQCAAEMFLTGTASSRLPGVQALRSTSATF